MMQSRYMTCRSGKSIKRECSDGIINFDNAKVYNTNSDSDKPLLFDDNFKFHNSVNCRSVWHIDGILFYLSIVIWINDDFFIRNEQSRKLFFILYSHKKAVALFNLKAIDVFFVYRFYGAGDAFSAKICWCRKLVWIYFGYIFCVNRLFVRI